MIDVGIVIGANRRLAARLLLSLPRSLDLRPRRPERFRHGRTRRASGRIARVVVAVRRAEKDVGH
ncbi:hypothetical protein MJS38_15160, partial [Burkholderia gladioli]